MADNELDLVVKADTAQATVSFSDLMNALSQTSVKSKEAATGLSGVEKAAAGAAGGAKAVESEGTKLSEVLEDIGTHSRIVASGLEAMGLGGAEAAVRIDGLTEALKGLSGAVPELLLVVGAITAISVGAGLRRTQFGRVKMNPPEGRIFA